MSACKWYTSMSGETLPEKANQLSHIEINTGYSVGNFCKNPDNPENQANKKQYAGDGKSWAKCPYFYDNQCACDFYS